MKRIALPLVAVVIALPLLSICPSTARAQVTVGGFTGAYNRGHGGHPFVYLAVGGRVGAHLVGPLSAEIEGLHVPAQVNGRTVDFFAYRVLSRWEIRSDGTRPLLIAGLGWQQWRTWVCGGKSCADPEGPGQKFDYGKGLGLTVGAGIRFRTSGPVWFRIDGRFERSLFNEAPTNNNSMITLGAEISM